MLLLADGIGSEKKTVCSLLVGCNKQRKYDSKLRKYVDDFGSPEILVRSPTAGRGGREFLTPWLGIRLLERKKRKIFFCFREGLN